MLQRKKLKVTYRKTYVHNKFGRAMVKKEFNDFYDHQIMLKIIK